MNVFYKVKINKPINIKKIEKQIDKKVGMFILKPIIMEYNDFYEIMTDDKEIVNKIGNYERIHYCINFYKFPISIFMERMEFYGYVYSKDWFLDYCNIFFTSKKEVFNFVIDIIPEVLLIGG